MRIPRPARCPALPLLTRARCCCSGMSADAIDAATNQYEYDLGINDMLGARFTRKLEAM